MLILVVTQPSRLPATVLSRCQRLRMRAPSVLRAVAWLEATRGKGRLGRQCSTCWVRRLCWRRIGCRRHGQIWAPRCAEPGGSRGTERRIPWPTAERWVTRELPLRLRCFENWLTERIRRPCASRRLFDRSGRCNLLATHADGLEYTGAVRAGWTGSAISSPRSMTPINRGLALESFWAAPDAQR